MQNMRLCPVKLKFNNVNNSNINLVKTLIFSDLDATWPSRDICEHELLQQPELLAARQLRRPEPSSSLALQGTAKSGTQRRKSFRRWTHSSRI